MTLADALEAIRQHAGQQFMSVTVDVSAWQNRQEVEFTIYIAGNTGEGCLAHESAASLEDAVACVLAKLRGQPADPVGVAEAAIAGLDDPRR